MDHYFEDKIFDGPAAQAGDVAPGTYEGCQFTAIDWTGSDLSGFAFIDCRFEKCNLSNTALVQTRISGCNFTQCKCIGTYFDKSSPAIFSAFFTNTVLDLSGFHGLNLKSCRFLNCSLQEVDFSEANLSGLQLDNCNLAGALFDHSRLEGTDFSTAYDYRIDPAQNSIKKAIFTTAGLVGLLYPYDIVIK